MPLLFLFLMLLLTGCQTTHTGNNTLAQEVSYSGKQNQNAIYNRYKYKQHRYTQQQDTAPVKRKTKGFKEAVPTKEPRSRYGNPSTYNVDGRKYEVMRNATGYKTRGIASWYGTKFHKQRTSSGEPYNMYVMTAAHRTLPLPTYLRVKNLANGRVAIVKVNDRGPFHSNRILDLSYAAAVKLGIFPRGTASVEIETLVGPTGQGHYYLQAGAFSTATSAQQLKSKLARVSTSPVFIEHYNKHYIVKAGPFGNKRMVDNLKVQLAKVGVRGTFSVLA